MNIIRILLTFCCILFPVFGLNAQTKEEANLQELLNQIRREKFELILPQVMRENNIDIWIHVFRDGSPDPLSSQLGSEYGVFIFTDRGGDRIERAVFGHSSDLVQECGAYDIIAKPEVKIPLTAFPDYRMPLGAFYRQGGTEWLGGPNTELNFRFKGVGKFVAERDPKRIGVNYLEKLGSPVLYEIPRLRSDGLSHTDYNLLVKAIGDKYAARIVSAEYLITDFLSRSVKSEILLYKKIREKISESFERQFNSIVPGKTRFGDLEGSRSVVDKDGNRGRRDYVLQRGDLICLAGGNQSGGHVDREWEFGNFYELAWTRQSENLYAAWIEMLFLDAEEGHT